MLSNIISAANKDNFSEISCALQLLSSFNLYVLLTGPLSSYSTIFIILIPISLSKFIIDLWIGAAPLHIGSNDA